MNMNEWNETPLPSFEKGTIFEATIRHCNPRLDLDDEVVTLKVGEDGLYLADGFNELSYNWDIIKWREFPADGDNELPYPV